MAKFDELSPEAQEIVKAKIGSLSPEAQAIVKTKLGLDEQKSSFPSLSDLAKTGSGVISKIYEGTKETFLPPINREQSKRFINPIAGQYGMSKVLQEAGEGVTKSADTSVKNLPPIVQKAYGLRPGDLTPSSFQEQIGTVPIGEGAMATIKPVAGAILKPVGKTIAKAAEAVSGLEYKTPGVLTRAFKDSSLIFGRGKEAAGELFQELMEKGRIRPEFAGAKSNEEALNLAMKYAADGTITAEEALIGRQSLDALKKSMPKYSFYQMRDTLDSIAKTKSAQADIAYSRAIDSDALRQILPVNKGGGTSIAKSTLGTIAGVAPLATMSPILQGSVATGAGVASRALGSDASAAILSNVVRERKKRGQKNGK